MPLIPVCLSQLQDARSFISHLLTYLYVFSMYTSLTWFLTPSQPQMLTYCNSVYLFTLLWRVPWSSSCLHLPKGDVSHPSCLLSTLMILPKAMLAWCFWNFPSSFLPCGLSTSVENALPPDHHMDIALLHSGLFSNITLQGHFLK